MGVISFFVGSKLCGSLVAVLASLPNLIDLLVHLCPVVESVLTRTGHCPRHTRWMPCANAGNLHTASALSARRITHKKYAHCLLLDALVQVHVSFCITVSVAACRKRLVVGHRSYTGHLRPQPQAGCLQRWLTFRRPL